MKAQHTHLASIRTGKAASFIHAVRHTSSLAQQAKGYSILPSSHTIWQTLSVKSIFQSCLRLDSTMDGTLVNTAWQSFGSSLRLPSLLPSPQLTGPKVWEAKVWWLVGQTGRWTRQRGFPYSTLLYSTLHYISSLPAWPTNWAFKRRHRSDFSILSSISLHRLSLVAATLSKAPNYKRIVSRGARWAFQPIYKWGLSLESYPAGQHIYAMPDLLNLLLCCLQCNIPALAAPATLDTSALRLDAFITSLLSNHVPAE